MKQIQFNETWEKLWINFMVFHPSADTHDELLFSCKSLGVDMAPMMQMRRSFKWMKTKYGADVRPWQISLEFDNNKSEKGQFVVGSDMISYAYTLRSNAIGLLQTERIDASNLCVRDIHM